jgi:hypothetical protein
MNDQTKKTRVSELSDGGGDDAMMRERLEASGGDERW